MAAELPRSPNVFHPARPSAVGSRNSLAQEGRDQDLEFKQICEEESERILQEISHKLPPEVLEKLDVMGGLKQKLYNYFNQNYQNMFNRYMVTTEDEMVKKVRNFIDREETKVFARYTPKEISEMLDQIGGADKFNTGEIEKSIVNMYGHLQGHVQRGLNDLENETNALLRQKSDVGAFIRGENAYSVIKCSFKDNAMKPKTVTDVKLSVNILDAELISPIFQYQATVEYLIKDQIARTVIDMIDREVERFQDELVDQGKEELSDSELMFEKMKRVPNFTDDDREDEQSLRYTFLAKILMDKIEGLRAEIEQKDFDQLNIRETLKKIIDMENLRNRGFNTAVNSITSILDTSKMGYQYIENLKNARELIIREYEDTDPERLPDERYQLRLKYYDLSQLEKERESYDKQMEEFKKEIQHMWDVVEVIYQRNKKQVNGVADFDDLAAKVNNDIRKMKQGSDEPMYEEMDKNWNEIMFIKSEDTDVERLNQTYIYQKTLFKKMMRKIREKIRVVYGYQNPQNRVILDQRLDFLVKEFEEFDYKINPYHIQSGLVLDVDINSIKRKKFTLNGMANVLNEFLHGISKGFQDAAFASFKRRRSTVREDINQSFASAPIETDKAKPSYAEALVPEPVAPAPAAPQRTVTPPPRPAVKGRADVTPRKRPGSDDLKEL